MAHVRIISVENPVPGGSGTSCDNYRHSKFVIRRKYVENELVPSMLRQPYESVEPFKAVVDPDFAYLIDRTGGGYGITWQGVTFSMADCPCPPCYLSHHCLWNMCVATGKTLLVLEDDVKLSPENEKLVYDTVAEYENGPYESDVLYLLTAIPYSETSLRTYAHKECRPISGKLKRVQRHNDFAGTAAYAIRPNAAKALLHRTAEIGAFSPDSMLHNSLNERRIGIVVMTKDCKGFMYNDHWSRWNHIHDPNMEVG